MIGVAAAESEHAIIAEFFELFKTPWELYKDGRRYDVLISTGGEHVYSGAAKLIILYAGHEVAIDREEKASVTSSNKGRVLNYKGAQIPIFGANVTFNETGMELTVHGEPKLAAVYRRRFPDRTVLRVGYDLFAEIGTLFSSGQPVEYAEIPTLELHISLLRDLIVDSGAPLVEVPPVPDGYPFIACLTHDVDHPSIRDHRWDHTIYGFLYRALLGSVKDFVRWRIPLRSLIDNWLAALRLPFVYLGVARDFWTGFADRYLELERELASTFFVIPVKDYPGRDSRGLAPQFRASSYAAKEIAAEIMQIQAAGGEVGLHGIDAWIDSAKGREEIEEIQRLTKLSGIGVRMHWLFYDDQHSPMILEEAGAQYDSTVGYRERVGYRAGTTQAYKPLRANRLLELPMHVMDTALFYPPYMNLSQSQAIPLLKQMVNNMVKFGGCMTINWHDRSLAPERAWCACYRRLVDELKNQKAWFATAGQAASWFRMRRSVVFTQDEGNPSMVCAKITTYPDEPLPSISLRGYNLHESYRMEDSPSCVYPMGTN